MPDAIWIDRDDELQALALRLSRLEAIGVDTEFLRERTFFPKLCLLQIAAGGEVWCIDALRADLGALVPVLTSTATRKVIHAARQDLEAFCLTSKRVMTPIFDSQIAAACVGMKPQIGYADLAQALLGVTVSKDQTRTDWSRRPLRRNNWLTRPTTSFTSSQLPIAWPRDWPNSAERIGSWRIARPLPIRGCISRTPSAPGSGYAGSSSSTLCRALAQRP